ncbi:hypothetical protein [Rosistilla oblonga]|uniref:Uncharacterized protein n=1 Tax=Rosistilla oblonga TaxID=2527990 RepID=A0A518IV86_9BACT|nr:hypothetical protein [Rosistilla oblonga]QDV57000.1 hypothetical protein Mal33_30010 [Rosistilla oblonga]
MAEHFRFTIPQPPFAFLIRRMFSEDAFVRDISLLGDVTTEQRSQVATALAGETFANSETIDSALRQSGVNEPKKVASVLQRLSVMFRESETEKEEAQDAFSSALSSSEIGETKRESIQSAFRELCLAPVALDLQKKAERLSSATGCAVEGLDVVCDIRPIFNPEGERIVGAIPYFTLRIEYDDGESQKIDLHLSNENMDRLKEVVDRAICKRDVMESTIASMKDWSRPRVD